MKFFLYLLQVLLYPLSLLYQFLFFLNKTFTKKKSLPVSFVVSVGNLSVGGTGKTPFTIYLANTINSIFPNRKIVILTRGYGGKKTKDGMVVQENSNPKESGDEPLLIKRACPFADVFVGKDRYFAFHKFYKSIVKETIVILDDGFQHHKLNRDFDFILIDSKKNIGNDFTLPIGSLREKPKSLHRANSVVFTKIEGVQKENLLKLEQNFKKINPKLNFYKFHYIAKLIKNQKTEFNIQKIAGKKILIFTGIANPQHFQKTIQIHNPSQIHFNIFSDHHPFTKSEIQNILSKSSDFDFILCTEKDYVKIEDYKDLPLFQNIYYVPIQTRIDNFEGFEKEIKTALLKKNY